jgi:hypothetical protein
MGAPLDFNVESSTDSAGDHSLLNGALTVGQDALVNAFGKISGLEKSVETSKENHVFGLQSIVIIVIGLILLAAGIFAFKDVRTTVISAGKTAAKAAAL